MKINGNSVKTGNIIEHKNSLFTVTKIQHTKPGKSVAYIQMELKDITNGTKLIERFRSTQSLEKIRLDEKKCTFLFKENTNAYFMDTDNFEQYKLEHKDIRNNEYLHENMNVTISFHNKEAVGVTLPKHIQTVVIKTESAIKNQTSASSYKPAVIENNIKIMVPSYIKENTKIIVEIETGKYIEKAKD
jgi:elongation factor P